MRPCSSATHHNTLDMENESDHPPRGLVENKERGAFYKDAADYWSQIPATVDGMLGGYGHISTVDIKGSTQFLRQLFRLKVAPGKERAIDCGAGIGRITKNLLFNHFKKVDLVEQDPAFVAQARTALEAHSHMGNFYCSGLQSFEPEADTYDVIWCQWVLGHLKDDDLIQFLQRCIRGIKENGIIVIKENATTSTELDEDSTDSSVTRPLDHLCRLLQEAGLRCVKQTRQENFPHGLYPVYMIATRPLNQETSDDSLNQVGINNDLSASNTSESFEEEANGFNCQVEYSSDDSTKTEVSPTDTVSNRGLKFKHLSNENNSNRMREVTDKTCDIV